MKGQTKNKIKMANLLAKIGGNIAIEGAGDPTHWAFYEFEIPKAVRDKITKKDSNTKEN